MQSNTRQSFRWDRFQSQKSDLMSRQSVKGLGVKSYARVICIVGFNG